MIFSIVGTFIIYMLSIWLLKSVLDLYFILDIVTLGKIFGLAIVSWLPFFLYYKLKTRCFPEEHEKIRDVSVDVGAE
jgi:hypothetical protein